MFFKFTSLLITLISFTVTGCNQRVSNESDVNPESFDNNASALVSTSQTYDVLLQKPTISDGITKVAQYDAKSYIYQNPADTKQLDIKNVPITTTCTSTTSCKVSTSGVISLSQSGYVVEVYIDGTDVGSSTANGNPAFLTNTTLPRNACQNAGLGTIAGSTNAGYEVNYWGRTNALVGGGGIAYKVWNGLSWVNAKFKKNVFGKYQWVPASSSDPQAYSTSTSSGLSFCN